jgi:hypothetical protein
MNTVSRVRRYANRAATKTVNFGITQGERDIICGILKNKCFIERTLAGQHNSHNDTDNRQGDNKLYQGKTAAMRVKGFHCVK